nr:DUF3426 domain-containing protein [uncultured Desulfobacter sp.]
MIITCEKCATRFVLDDALIKPGGSKVRCSKCLHVFTAFPPEYPEFELPDHGSPGERHIPFEEPEFQAAPNLNESQNGDLSLDDDSDAPDTDREDSDIDFSEIDFDDQEFEENSPEPKTELDVRDSQDQALEIDEPSNDFDEDGLDFETADFDIEEPELDFQDDELELDTQDLELESSEDEIASELLSMADDSDTADIEISFDQDGDEESGLELEELSFELEDSAEETPPLNDLELDSQEDDGLELEFEDDSQADLILEPDGGDDGQDLSLDSDDVLIEPSAQTEEESPEARLDIEHDLPPSDDFTLEPDGGDDEEPDTQETDEEIEPTVSEQDKFSEYDKVLEQETEPEDSGLAIPEAQEEEDDTTFEPDATPSPTDDEIDALTEAPTDQEPVITPLSAQSVRQKRGAKNKKGLSPAVKILLVLVLLLLAAYVAVMRLGVTIPVVSDIQIPFISQWLAPKQAPRPPPKPVLDEPSINGRFVSNQSAGDLFIVTGKVKNPSNTAVSYIRVKGTLMKKNNTKAGTLIAYCGNIIPEETLKTGNISDITKQMGVKQGNQNTNVNIKPGASVMFMLIFSNLPEDLSNFTVAVHGFEAEQK